jgi:hypothetical protein
MWPSIQEFEQPAPVAAPTPAAAGEAPIEIAGPPAMLSIDEIYTRAKLPVSPDTGTVLKIILLTADPNLAALPRETKGAMVRAALAADRTTPETIIDDAVGRDRALDAAQEYLEQGVAAFETRARDKVAELEAERERMLTDFNARITAIREAVDTARRELAAWRRQKGDVERSLFDALSMLLSSQAANPITLDTEGPSALPRSGGTE